jgi:hypothetical protein
MILSDVLALARPRAGRPQLEESDDSDDDSDDEDEDDEEGEEAEQQEQDEDDNEEDDDDDDDEEEQEEEEDESRKQSEDEVKKSPLSSPDRHAADKADDREDGPEGKAPLRPIPGKGKGLLHKPRPATRRCALSRIYDYG